MTLYEGLLAVHVLAAATWFGSGLAINVVAGRLLRAGSPDLGTYVRAVSGWASRAHPAAAVVLLLTAFGMVADADLSLGEAWLSIALAGLVIAAGLGGAVISPAAGRLVASLGDGAAASPTGEQHALASRLLTFTRIETLLLGLVIIDMVVKPGA